MLGPVGANSQELLALYFRLNRRLWLENARRIVAALKDLSYKEHADVAASR
jgi:hypothetical protein